jgi:hypothetical protein
VQVRLLAQKATWQRDEPVVVWVVALNDTYQDATLDRRLLVGPTPILAEASRPLPVSLESPTAREEDNCLLLQPFCLYGRQREFGGLPPGQLTFHAYLLDEPVSGAPPVRAQDVQAAHSAAEPLELTILD